MKSHEDKEIDKETLYIKRFFIVFVALVIIWFIFVGAKDARSYDKLDRICSSSSIPEQYRHICN